MRKENNQPTQRTVKGIEKMFSQETDAAPGTPAARLTINAQEAS